MTEQQEVGKYKELAKNLLDQFYTKENIQKMQETIANRESFRKEYSRGGTTMPRGYYCPSLISELVITNCKRGRLLKKLPARGADYCYYFSGDRLVLVQQFHEDVDFCDFEWINRIGSIEYAICQSEEFDREPYITVSEYDENNRLVKNILRSCYFDDGVSLKIETYAYNQESQLVRATWEDIFVHRELLYEMKNSLTFKYDDQGQLLAYYFDGSDEGKQVPAIVKKLITGSPIPEKKQLREKDVLAALQQTVTPWKGEDIYAISVFVNHDGDEVTDFTVSYNIEENQVGEARWNCAFWDQEEESLLDLLDERKTDWKQLLEFVAAAVRKLHKKGIFRKLFGKDIAVIIHGYEYEDADLEATRQANPNDQAKEFFETLDSWR